MSLPHRISYPLMPLIALAIGATWVTFVPTVKCLDQTLVLSVAVSSSVLFWSIIMAIAFYHSSEFPAMLYINLVLGCGLGLLTALGSAYLNLLSLPQTSCPASLVLSILLMNGISGIVSALVYGLLGLVEYLANSDDNREKGYALIWTKDLNDETDLI